MLSSLEGVIDSLGLQILAAAASNMAVDNLVEKLVQANPKVNLVRVGHPARMLPQVILF